MKTEVQLGKEFYPCYITADVDEYLQYLSENEAKLWGLDIETAKVARYATHKSAGLDPNTSIVRLLQLYDGKEVFILDLAKQQYSNKWAGTTEMSQLYEWMKVHKFLAHNALFEIAHLEYRGFTNLDIACSQLLGTLVDRAEYSPGFHDEGGTDLKKFSLANLYKKYFRVTIPKEKQASDWSKKLTLEQYHYAGRDAIATYNLGCKLIKKVKKYGMLDSYKLLKQVQHPVAEMQTVGMYSNNLKHDTLIKKWEGDKAKHAIKCRRYFGNRNLGSPKQLGEWLEETQDELTINSWPRSPTGKYTFNQSVITDFAHMPAIKTLKTYKKTAKLLNTYGKKLQKDHLSPATSAYHSSFKLAKVRTGRLASSKPNLQNIARDSEVREIFEAHPGNDIILADYSQIEMRIAGELSRDEYILDAFETGKDLHRMMAQDILDRMDVTDDERYYGKHANFGFLFGMGAPRFIKYLQEHYSKTITLEEATAIKKKFYKRYAGYIRWCHEQRDIAEKLGYVRTPLGRMRKLLSEEVYTKSINTPIQGGAAEVILLALCKLRPESLNQGQYKIVNCVHDEIILECSKVNSALVSKYLEDIMTRAYTDMFPGACTRGLVEAGIGDSWQAAKKDAG